MWVLGRRWSVPITRFKAVAGRHVACVRVPFCGPH